MNPQYLIRLDDACPTMNRAKWEYMEGILDYYGVKPLVGVIPHNEDPQQIINPEDNSFWAKVDAWIEKGWDIAMHGYNHCYCSNKGMEGINPMWSRSEFAGLPLEVQREKIRCGVSIMREHGVNPRFFFAPSHTFDNNTLEALQKESDVRVLSDTIGRFPYKNRGFWFIPQIAGHCVKIPLNGIFTFCFHPNNMDDTDFDRVESFLKKNSDRFICFNDIILTNYKEKTAFDKLLSWLYFRLRELKEK